MAKGLPIKGELDQVAGAQIPQFAGMGRRAFGFFLTDYTLSLHDALPI